MTKSGVNVHREFKLKGEPNKPETKNDKTEKEVPVSKADPKPKVKPAKKKAQQLKQEKTPGFALEYQPVLNQHVRVVMLNNESFEGVLKKAYMYTLQLQTDEETIVMMKSAVAYVMTLQ